VAFPKNWKRKGEVLQMQLLRKIIPTRGTDLTHGLWPHLLPASRGCAAKRQPVGFNRNIGKQ